MTRADLPAKETRRWVASRKASVVRAISHGLISETEAQKIYSISEEELESWTQAVEIHGERALKATAVQNFRRTSSEQTSTSG